MHPEFIPGFKGVVLSVVGDVSVNGEAHVVTSLIFRFAGAVLLIGIGFARVRS